MTQEQSTTNSGGFGFQRYLKIARPFFIIFGLAIIFYLVRKIGLANFWEILRHISPGYMFLALIAWLLNLSFATLRFRSLAAPDLKYFKVFEIVLISYLVNYGSMVQGVGYGARIGLLKGENVAVARSLAGSGAEAIFDLLFTVSVTLVFALYVGLAQAGLGTIHPLPFIIGAALGLGVLGAILFFGRRGGFLGRFVDGLKEAMSLKRFGPNLLYTAAIWLLASAGYYFVVLATGAKLNPLLAIAGQALGFVGGLVSLVPGGLGVRDILWTYVSSLGGVPIENSGTAALLMRFLYITTVALLVTGLGIVRKRLEAQD